MGGWNGGQCGNEVKNETGPRINPSDARTNH